MRLLFLQLYAAHLIADFLLQPNWIAQNKTKLSSLAAHSGIHALCSCALVNIGMNWGIATGIAILSITHSFIDYLKAKVVATGWRALLLDQAIHLVLVLAVAAWFSF